MLTTLKSAALYQRFGVVQLQWVGSQPQRRGRLDAAGIHKRTREPTIDKAWCCLHNCEASSEGIASLQLQEIGGVEEKKDRP